MGNTALHTAAETGQMFVAAFLRLYGASPLVRNNAGKTPLQLAVEGNNVATAGVGFHPYTQRGEGGCVALDLSVRLSQLLFLFACFCLFLFCFCFLFLFFVFVFCFWFVVCSPSLCCCASQVLRLSDSQLKALSVHLQRQPLSRKRTTSRDVERHGLPTGSTPGPAPTRVGAQGNEFIQLEELGQILSRLWHCTLDACRVLRTFRAKEAERQRAAVTTPSPHS